MTRASISAADPAGISAVLAENRHFSGLSPDELAQIASAAHRVRYARGQVVNPAGQPISSLHVVESGLLGRNLVTAGGTERILELCGPRECCGLGDIFCPSEEPVQLVAIETSHAIVVPGRTVLAVCERNPALSFRIATDLARNQHALESELVVSHCLTANDRVLRFLKAAWREAGGTSFDLPASKQVVAGRIGLTPESFSRALRDLMDSGVIVNRGRSIVFTGNDSGTLGDALPRPSGTCLSRAASAHRSPIRMAELINFAGRQRMLAERMARTALMIAFGVATNRTRNLLGQSMEQFERQQSILAAHPAARAVGPQLKAAAEAWKHYKDVLALAPRADRAGSLLSGNRALIQASDALVAALAESGGDINLRLVNLAGRQRMLAQRMAKNFIHRQMKGCIDPAEPALISDCEQFADNLQRLGRTARDWPEARESLRRVGLRWLGMQGLLQSEKPGLDRSAAAAKVSTLCEQVVREMEAVVSEFERHIGPAAPQADRARHAA